MGCWVHSMAWGIIVSIPLAFFFFASWMLDALPNTKSQAQDPASFGASWMLIALHGVMNQTNKDQMRSANSF